MPKRNILAADDIGNQTEAGKRRSEAIGAAASWLSERLKTGVDLLYVEDIKTFRWRRPDEARIRKLRALDEERLEKAGRRLRVPVRCLLRTGSPPDRILDILRSRNAPELVVLGTQGRRGMKRLFIGSVSEEVVRHSRRPVMVIGPRVQDTGVRFNNRKEIRILVATDLGKNSRAAEQYALSLAKRLGAGVVLFHCLWDSYRAVLDRSLMPAGIVPFNLDELIALIRDDCRKLIRQKTSFYQDRGVPCESRMEEAAVTSACAVYQEADKGSSLVVMGTHGRNMLLSAFFGSTARETILNASVPVIIVHSGR